jgi:hypothetical protein
MGDLNSFATWDFVKIGFVSQKRCGRRLLPLLLRRLSKTYTWPATVLVNELDAGFLEGAFYNLKGSLDEVRSFQHRDGAWVGPSFLSGQGTLS